jgi:hypothetical protein
MSRENPLWWGAPRIHGDGDALPFCVLNRDFGFTYPVYQQYAKNHQK